LSKQTNKQGISKTKQEGNKKQLSILTPNVISFSPPINSKLEKKTQPYFAYKELISLKKLNTGLESKTGKKFSKQMDHIDRQE
jgi:hypothetical protein